MTALIIGGGSSSGQVDRNMPRDLAEHGGVNVLPIDEYDRLAHVEQVERAKLLQLLNRAASGHQARR